MHQKCFLSHDKIVSVASRHARARDPLSRRCGLRGARIARRAAIPLQIARSCISSGWAGCTFRAAARTAAARGTPARGTAAAQGTAAASSAAAPAARTAAASAAASAACASAADGARPRGVSRACGRGEGAARAGEHRRHHRARRGVGAARGNAPHFYPRGANAKLLRARTRANRRRCILWKERSACGWTAIRVTTMPWRSSSLRMAIQS